MRDQMEKSVVLHGSAVRDEVKAPELMKKKATVTAAAHDTAQRVGTGGGGGDDGS